MNIGYGVLIPYHIIWDPNEPFVQIRSYLGIDLEGTHLD